MKEYIAICVALLIIIFAVSFGVRAFNNAATKITISEPEPGVRCALATSTDGVAIDCWKREDES